jgi:hypothetical protein
LHPFTFFSTSTEFIVMEINVSLTLVSCDVIPVLQHLTPFQLSCPASHLHWLSSLNHGPLYSTGPPILMSSKPRQPPFYCSPFHRRQCFYYQSMSPSFHTLRSHRKTHTPPVRSHFMLTCTSFLITRYTLIVMLCQGEKP